MDRFNAGSDTACAFLICGLLLAPALTAVSRLLPWRQSRAARRPVLAVLAPPW
ncbi:hypothetical protein [Streptomyces sp. NBC_01589]|uniref:hypothetical protein n=1 Tax=unclassified Streptomyces TaxID=2593676 RepID=UPI0038664A99